MSDGAACLVLMSEQAAKDRGLKPLARILSYDDASVSPTDFGVATIKAIPKALKRANLNFQDVEYHEIHESFAATVLANIKLLELDFD